MARSRRTTPQAQRPVASAPVSTVPAAPRATRARSTRSQSEDIPIAVSQPAPSRTRKNARQQSVESVSSVEGRSSRVQRRNAKDEAAVRDLTTVEEDPLSDEEVPDSIPHAEDATTPPPNFHAGIPSPGAISGTTAFSSLAASEAEGLLPEEMIPNLPALYNTAEELIRVSVPPHASATRLRDLIQETKKPGASSAKRLNQAESAFASYKDDFGERSTYINVQGVMKSIFTQSLPSRDSSSWRVVEILQAANLAWLARWTFSAERDNSGTWDQLRKLDSRFPLDFLSSIRQLSPGGAAAPLMIGSSSLLEETFHVALEIRTQVAVLAIAQQYQEEDFDPEEVLRVVFYSTTPSGTETLNVWDVDGLGGDNQELPSEFDQAIQQRISSIRQGLVQDTHALSSGASTELHVLQTLFPWSNFAVRTLEWIRRRNAELTTSIKERGGVEKTVASLKEQLSIENSMLESPAVPRPMIAASTSRGSAQPSAKKKKSRQRIDYKEFHKLRKFKRQSDAALEETSAVAPPQPNSGADQDADVAQHQNMGDDDWQPLDDRESEPVVPEPSQRIQRVQSKSKSNKENVRLSDRSGPSKPRSFISPQPDARRLNWDEESQDGSQRERAKPQQQSQGVAGKRARPSDIQEEDDEISDDEGYERDVRQSTAADTRRQELNAARRAKQPARSSPKRPRTEAAPADDRESPASLTPEYDINRQTQSNVRRSTQVPVRALPKPPQKRRPWTLDEEIALIEYVEEYGTSWSLIKQADKGIGSADDDEGDGPNLLKYRDQVALKDKARNIRFDYHKKGVNLPPHFKNVTLTKLQKNTLEALGIEYEDN